MRAGLHAGERAFQPVHLAELAKIQRALAGDRMHAHDRLALRRSCGRSARGVSPASTASRPRLALGADVNALQPVDPRLEFGGQRLIRRGPSANSVCPWPCGTGVTREEQRDVRRRAAIALVGVPAPAMRKLRRQLAVFGQRRIGPARRLRLTGGMFETMKISGTVSCTMFSGVRVCR